MPKFRKKPVIVEAEQFRDAGAAPLPFAKFAVCALGPTGWYVDTLEGPLHISNGDWIIRGIQGEYYPCKPDIFTKTYELVEEV